MICPPCQSTHVYNSVIWTVPNQTAMLEQSRKVTCPIQNNGDHSVCLTALPHCDMIYPCTFKELPVYIFKKKFKTLLLRKVYYDCWLILWSAFNKVPTVPGKLGILSFTFPGGKCLKFAPKVWKTWNFNSKPEKTLNFENFMLPDNF